MGEKVTFIGAGAIGSALGSVLSKKGVDIYFWDVDQSRLKHKIALEDALLDADFVFLCVPSWAIRDVGRKIKPYLARKSIIISLAKGIEADSHKTMDRVLAEVLPRGQRFVLLAGALLAEELSGGEPGYGVIAGANHDACRKVGLLFKNSALTVFHSSDPSSTALCSILKNVYAIAIGIANGLDWGYNAKGQLTYLSLEEMRRIAATLRRDYRLIDSPAGVSDFIATGFSPTSKNHELGEDVVEGIVHKSKREGQIAIEALTHLLKNKTDKMPIFRALQDIFVHNKKAKEVFVKLVSNQFK